MTSKQQDWQKQHRTVRLSHETHKALEDMKHGSDTYETVIKRLIEDHKTLDNWDGDPYESPWADAYRAQREKTRKEIEGSEQTK